MSSTRRRVRQRKSVAPDSLATLWDAGEPPPKCTAANAHELSELVFFGTESFDLALHPHRSAWWAEFELVADHITAAP